MTRDWFDVGGFGRAREEHAEAAVLRNGEPLVGRMEIVHQCVARHHDGHMLGQEENETVSHAFVGYPNGRTSNVASATWG